MIFPLPEDATYSYAQRFSDGHEGTDIMAPLGTPVLAAETGVAWSNIEPRGGKCAYLLGESGEQYYYGHLSEWKLQLISATKEEPLRVYQGDELGKVGTTGNAVGRPPHLHFEMRRGLLGVKHDPFPELAACDPHQRGKPSTGPAGGGGGLFAGFTGLENAASNTKVVLVLAALWWISKQKGRFRL